MGNYNSFALEYSKGTIDLEEETRSNFYSLLPALNGKFLLDVGCGSGHDIKYYAQKGAIVSGIDISKEQIAMTKKGSSGDFTVGNMKSLPYDSEKFDVITSVYALQTSDNVEESLLEMVRVAKPEASIVVLTKHPIRNCLEGYVNDRKLDYYKEDNVTSYIFNKSIKLSEPRHTLMEYLPQLVLQKAKLEKIEEHTDFPASEQVIPGLIYPTYMILKFTKNSR